MIIPQKTTFLFFMFQVGGATAVGEQPIKGLVDADCGARMSVGEALTNLVWARITSLKVSIFQYYDN